MAAKQPSSSVFKKWLFIVLASLIPVSIYLNRFLIPDGAYDTLYYHLFNGVRAAHNLLWPFSKGEFYPAGFGTLPAIYDSLLYTARLILGYRLGTVLSLIAYLGVIYLVYKMLRLVFDLNKLKLRAYIVCVFFVNCVIVTELLFQLATYYVDIIDIFLVLLGLYIFLIYTKNSKQRYLWISAVIFGIAFLAKATNIIYVLPFLTLVGIHSYLDKEAGWVTRLRVFILVLAITFMPTVLYDIRNYILTGNPVYPLYNGLFKSDYYSPVSFSPSAYGFGGTNFLQKLLWPIAAFWHASRLSAPHDIFNDWKLSVEWLLALFLFIPGVWHKIGIIQKYLAIFFFISVAIWGLTSGILRYAALDELIGGLLVFSLFVRVYGVLNKRKVLGAVLVVVSLALIAFDNYRIIAFNFKYDVSWRPGYTNSPAAYIQEAKNLFDNHLNYPPEVVIQLSSSQITLNCAPQSAGLLSLSGFANKPLLNIISAPPNQQMTGLVMYRTAAATRLADIYHTSTLGFATLVMSDRSEDAYQACLQNIKLAGARVTGVFLLDSYLGYAPYEKPIVITGSLNIASYVRGTQTLNIPITDASKLQAPNQQMLLRGLLQPYH